MESRLQEQIEKHELLIKQRGGDNEDTKFKMTIFEECGHKETKHYEIFIEQIKFNELHIKHSGYMIRIFQGYIEHVPANPPKFVQILKVCLGLLKSGAGDIEDNMRGLVELGYYKEQEYKEHMEGFMAEINAWESAPGL